LEAVAVLEDVFLGVPASEAEIENIFPVLAGNAPGFGAEAMDEPGELCESGRLQDSHAAHFAFDPVSDGWAGRDRQECLSYRSEFAGLAFGL
jgi:hypothetical protein